LVYGARACWLMSIASYFIDFEYQLLLLAAAMIVSYIIPGYVLNARYKKANG
jgi:low temperature requirement protein LtrA